MTKISPLLLDWLEADGASVAVFIEEALKTVESGRAARRGAGAWPAADGTNARAVRAHFGLGLVASWSSEEGTFHLEHVEDVARLIVPHRLPLTWEQAIVGRSFADVADLPFPMKPTHAIVDVHDMQAGQGIAILFEAEPVAL